MNVGLSCIPAPLNLVLQRLSDLRLDFEVFLYHLLMQSFEMMFDLSLFGYCSRNSMDVLPFTFMSTTY